MKSVIFFQAFAAALMISPLLIFNSTAFAGNSDALFYTTILRLVSDHMMMGDIRPLWLGEANGGTGSPVMLFYGPLACQLTALIGLPIASLDPYGWQRLVLGMFVAQWLAGIAAYVWLCRLVRPAAAMAASLLFTIFPYKLVYIFLHINLAQIWALLFLPLLMIAAFDLARGKRRAIGWYGLWLALLALTHGRTLVAFAAVPALYALCFAERPRYKILLMLVAAHALGMALAAFYLLPATMNLSLIQADLANTGRAYYASNLSHKDVALNFHYAVIACLVIGLLVRVPALRRTRIGGEAAFHIVMLLGAALLCLRFSQPIWDALPILQFLQFPAARLHAVALIAATMLAAIFFQHYEKAHEPVWLYSPSALLVPVGIMIAFTFYYINGIYRGASGITPSYIQQMHRLNTIPPTEYLTHWQPTEDNSPETIRSRSALPLAMNTTGNGRVEATFTGVRKIHLKASGDPGLVTLRQLYLPQWRTPGIEIRNDQDGMIQMDLPPNSEINLKLAPFPGERLGKVISLAAVWVIGLLILLPRARRKWPTYRR